MSFPAARPTWQIVIDELDSRQPHVLERTFDRSAVVLPRQHADVVTKQGHLYCPAPSDPRLGTLARLAGIDA